MIKIKKFEFIGGKKIDISVVKELESKLNVSFPEAYIKLITENNDACIVPDAFQVAGNVESINNFHSVEEYYHFSDERLPMGIVPFARDAGDNQICFDFRENGKVSVYFWDYEIEAIEDGALQKISNSFEEFLDMLFEFDE